MPKKQSYFNVLPSASGEASLILYGEIGDWSELSSAKVVSSFMELERSYKKIDVRINSVGGEVYAGMAIYQALANSKADVTIYVDGIAASMAAIIALCGKPLYMSPFSRLMLHNVSGGSWGNSKELRETAEHMESLQQDLARMIAGRLGKQPEEIEDAYFNDGKDHWITAREALELGLIDGIYNLEDEEGNLSDSSTAEEIEKYFTNRLNNQALKDKDMALLDELRRGCPAITASMGDAEAAHAVAEMYARLGVKDEENKQLRARVEALEGEANAALLNEAVSSGKIAEAQRERYAELLKAAPEETRELLNSLPARKTAPRAADYIGKESGPSNRFAGRSWKELDRSGDLVAFKREDPEGFNNLYKETWGKSYED